MPRRGGRRAKLRCHVSSGAPREDIRAAVIVVGDANPRSLNHGTADVITRWRGGGDFTDGAAVANGRLSVASAAGGKLGGVGERCGCGLRGPRARAKPLARAASPTRHAASARGAVARPPSAPA